MLARRFTALPLVALAATLAGCPRHPLERPEIALTGQTTVPVPLDLQRDVDLLVLVDNSSSMASKQANLAANFPKLMLALGRFQGGFPNAHIGVVSSDLGAGSFSIETCRRPGGDRGQLQSMPRGACTGPSDGKKYIEVNNVDNELQANVPDVTREIHGSDGSTSCPTHDDPMFSGDGHIDTCDIAEAFTCIARLGNEGCGFEMHMEAVLRALSPPNTDEGGPNAGFLRDGSLLTVVILGDEDDCSAQRGELFDPSNNTNNSMLGPLQSWRCVEFGYHCQVGGTDSCSYQSCPQTIPRVGGSMLANCRSDNETDIMGDERLWLYPPSRYINFFKTIRSPQKFIYGDIGADFAPGDTLQTQLDQGNNTQISPSCFGPGPMDHGDPAVRRREVVDAMNQGTDMTTGMPIHDGIWGKDINADVCSSDYTPIMDELATRIRQRLTPGCVPNPLINSDGVLIDSPDQAECTVQETSNTGSVALPSCTFEGAHSNDCPGEGARGAAVTNAPCWYFCDSASLGAGACDVIQSTDHTHSLTDLGYEHRWQFRVCRTGACDPTTAPPAGAVANLACLTCSLDANSCSVASGHP